MRDLTNRLSSDEGRNSDFPRSFFNHHRSIFDHQTPMYVTKQIILTGILTVVFFSVAV